jgi:hypothetical protein
MQGTLKHTIDLPLVEIEVCLHAYNLLENSLLSFLGDKDRRILAYPLEICPMIISFLEHRTTMALLLFLHYGVVLHLITGKWHARGAGRRLVASLLPALKGLGGEEGEMWREVVEWGKRSVGI